MSESPKRSRVLITEEEHKLLQRYREQARAFNEGLAAAMKVVQENWNISLEDMERKLAELRKDTP